MQYIKKKTELEIILSDFGFSWEYMYYAMNVTMLY